MRATSSEEEVKMELKPLKTSQTGWTNHVVLKNNPQKTCVYDIFMNITNVCEIHEQIAERFQYQFSKIVFLFQFSVEKSAFDSFSLFSTK